MSAGPSSYLAGRMRGKYRVVGECWLWTAWAPQQQPGLKVEGRTAYVRPLLWEDLHGPVPPDMRVHPRCGNALCVAPEHLVLDRSFHRRGARWRNHQP